MNINYPKQAEQQALRTSNIELKYHKILNLSVAIAETNRTGSILLMALSFHAGRSIAKKDKSMSTNITQSAHTVFTFCLNEEPLFVKKPEITSGFEGSGTATKIEARNTMQKKKGRHLKVNLLYNSVQILRQAAPKIN